MPDHLLISMPLGCIDKAEMAVHTRNDVTTCLIEHLTNIMLLVLRGHDKLADLRILQ